MSAPLQSFELFSKSPYDIRRLIWDAYLDSYPARVFHLRIVFYGSLESRQLECWRKPTLPPIFHVCRESRAAAVAYSVLHGYQDKHGVETFSSAVWFRPEKDIVYLDSSTTMAISYPNHDQYISPDSYPFGLDRAHNLGLHHSLLANGEAMITLRELYIRIPHVDTIYLLLPQRCWVSGMHEPWCCLKLPLTLVDIPDSFQDFEYSAIEDEEEITMWMAWPDAKLEITNLIHSMAESNEIPREPKLHGKFTVRPTCSGRSGAPCPLISPRSEDDWIAEADITGVRENLAFSRLGVNDAKR